MYDRQLVNKRQEMHSTYRGILKTDCSQKDKDKAGETIITDAVLKHILVNLFPFTSSSKGRQSLCNCRKLLSDTWWLLLMRLRTRLGHGQYLFLCYVHRRSREI